MLSDVASVTPEGIPDIGVEEGVPLLSLLFCSTLTTSVRESPSICWTSIYRKPGTSTGDLSLDLQGG